MKYYLIYSILICFISCNTKNKYDNDCVRPVSIIGDSLYGNDDFEILDQVSKDDDYSIWLEMNHSNYEFGVHLINEKLVITESKKDSFDYVLDSGVIQKDWVDTNNVVGLFHIPFDSTKTKQKVFETELNIYHIFDYDGKLYFLVGGVFMRDRGGALLEIFEQNGRFKCKEVLNFQSSPQTLTIFDDKILLVCYKRFIVLDKLKKKIIIEDAFWSSLWPNSIVAKNEDEIFIGMRGGYSKLSLKTQEIQYHKYIDKK